MNMFRLYNTLTNKKEKFQSIEKGKVRMYTCGPTVYDYAHIGNFAAYIFADLLRRQLDYLGYEVRHIVNITDVGHLTADDVNQADSGEDKMLKAALREKKDPKEIADFYTDCFFQDIEKLNLKKAQYYPRATAHISHMVKIIEGLIEKELAYESNGNVFYDVKKFKEYGKLSNKRLDELIEACRLEKHPDKKECFDFALWLKAPKKHLLKYNSPWSVGYPGWHIECSAMSMEYLGETLDIHSGGEDHVFPHHENEIAQSEGFTGKPFANFWFHNRFLLVDGAKMSKSKGNFYVLKDILDKGYDPMAFRLMIISSHYRSNLNFTWESMDQAKVNLEKIARFFLFVSGLAGETNKKPSEVPNGRAEGGVAPSSNSTANKVIDLKKYKEKFETAMNDDLNSPLALSVLYELITEINKRISEKSFGREEAKEVLTFWKKINSVLGLKIETEKEAVPEKVKKLISDREVARQEKDFKKADKLREEIKRAGYSIEDTAKGQVARKK